MYSKAYHLYFIGIIFTGSALVASCSGDTKNGPGVQAERELIPAHDQPPTFSGEITVNTFEVKDSSGVSSGWGYDICVDGKAAIHQPIIPGIQGNRSFPSAEKARITGELAASKMKSSGGLPTITIKELDSLGITK